MPKLILRHLNLADKKELGLALKRAKKILLNNKPSVIIGNLNHVVRQLLKKKQRILKLAQKHITPFFILDNEELENSINSYKKAFVKFLPQSEHYYAVKLNHYPEIIKKTLKSGFGLDVSSTRELKLGLSLGAKKIIFNGPAKTEIDLVEALKNHKNITVNIDSFSELTRLGKLAEKQEKSIRAGVRIFTKYHGEWTKFGIALNDLSAFWKKAKKFPRLNLAGVHFHISWNENALPYQKVIKDLSGYLKANFNQADLDQIKFIDIGGGFRPYNSEGYYPWRLPQGRIMQETANFFNEEPKFKHKFYIPKAITINEYARGIAEAIKKYLNPLVNCLIYTEPGRYISNNAMHFLTKLVDLKAPNYGVADGGINAIGWERFYYEYFPLINLTHPSLKEIDFTLYGSLCMHDDLWGYYCYAKKMREGDLILVPYQGALTYSLAQNFIKEIPPVYKM